MRSTIARSGACATLLALILSGCMVTRESVHNNGSQSPGDSHAPALSANGRHIAFESDGALVDGDTNGLRDIFVRNTNTGRTTRVSVTNAENETDDFGSENPGISSDGRYVVFESRSIDYLSDIYDDFATNDIFVRDTVAGTTKLVSTKNLVPPNGESWSPSISDSGAVIAFSSEASDIVNGDSNGVIDIFLRDTVNTTSELVSVDSDDNQANAHSGTPVVSGNGRFVVFASAANNLATGDTNGTIDVFVRDTLAETTTRVSVDSTGAQANGDSYTPEISADGRYVTFLSDSSNLVAGDTNGQPDVFVRDTVAGTTNRVSVSSSSTQANGPSGTGFLGYDRQAPISDNGRYVVFQSNASNLVPGDTNGVSDVFRRDMASGTTTRVSLGINGVQANKVSFHSDISANGQTVTFESEASNLVPGDSNNSFDVFSWPVT